MSVLQFRVADRLRLVGLLVGCQLGLLACGSGDTTLPANTTIVNPTISGQSLSLYENVDVALPDADVVFVTVSNNARAVFNVSRVDGPDGSVYIDTSTATGAEPLRLLPGALPSALGLMIPSV